MCLRLISRFGAAPPCAADPQLKLPSPPGASRRPNSRKPRSNDGETNRHSRDAWRPSRRRGRALLWRGDACASEADGPSLQLSRDEPVDRSRPARRGGPAIAVVRRHQAALCSFNEADHGLRDGSSLRSYGQACAAKRGVDPTRGRVLLLCYPRLLGFIFNPLSVYFCYASGRRGTNCFTSPPSSRWRCVILSAFRRREPIGCRGRMLHRRRAPSISPWRLPGVTTILGLVACRRAQARAAGSALVQ